MFGGDHEPFSQLHVKAQVETSIHSQGVISRFTENKLLGLSHGHHFEEAWFACQDALRAVPISKRPRERETGR